jgi:hypothetical protein
MSENFSSCVSVFGSARWVRAESRARHRADGLTVEGYEKISFSTRGKLTHGGQGLARAIGILISIGYFEPTRSNFLLRRL